MTWEGRRRDVTGSVRGLAVRTLGSGTARRLLENGLPRLDRAVYRATAGRASLSSLLSGLPVVMLTTTGQLASGRRGCRASS